MLLSLTRARPAEPRSDAARSISILRNICDAEGDRAMRQLYIITVALILATPALGQSLGEKTGVNSVLGITPSTADFVKEVAASDTFEIESSKLAQEKTQGPVKDFATQMITDHTKTSSDLSSQAKTMNITLSTTLDSSLQNSLDKLRTLSGADFEKQYLDDQVSAHKDAISLFERYGKGGDSAQLKAWAVSTLPTLQHHLEMAQNLDK
jgi:putative membrane protein